MFKKKILSVLSAAAVAVSMAVGASSAALAVKDVNYCQRNGKINNKKEEQQKFAGKYNFQKKIILKFANREVINKKILSRA